MKVAAIVDKKRRSGIAEATKVLAHPHCECVLFGVPKPAEVLDDLCGVAEVVFLRQASGCRQGFLLCARVDGDVWICHPGTLEDGALDANNPFAICDLVMKNVVVDRFDESTRVRITSKTKVDLLVGVEESKLLAAAAEIPFAWSQARAFALFRAEEARAESGDLD